MLAVQRLSRDRRGTPFVREKSDSFCGWRISLKTGRAIAETDCPQGVHRKYRKSLVEADRTG
jgi:hypothetical protein